ncbi:unnamed protein product (macronuclear) [Paramecium tetraurelia]|uniref:Uncharacterized protein n=1 Tax=Paramecium tetraurelia TaxID=5888 RepID=A0C824_PARTE|nr:uncharacterized protein GSPATT00036072001 [Paramecium tetraurelia]CAK66941.1 unnamed protein product [Paramecium tetraurelia]|eukprot:XP_001434338.1 hypothetical protein (macronuclear) [Paramecium tetraurelia strain d4-2]
MLHKNIPIPNQAKHPHFDLEPNSHKSDPIQQSSNSLVYNTLSSSHQFEFNNLKKQLEDKTKEIQYLRQTENQYKILSIQFQETNQNHQIELKQLLEQMDAYKQRTNHLKVQLEEYIREINLGNQKYQECYSQKEELSKQLKDQQLQYDNLQIYVQNKQKELIQLQDRVANAESQNLQSYEIQKRSQIDPQIKEINLINQVTKLENRNSELENKCALLAQEIERMRFNSNQNEIQHIKIENEQLKQNLQQMMLQIQQFKNIQNSSKIKEDNSIKDRMRIIVLNTEIERLWSVIEDCEHRNQEQIQQIEHLTQQLGLFEQRNLQFEQESMRKLQYEQDILLLQQQQDFWTQNQKELQNKCTLLTTEVERLNIILREKDIVHSKYQYEIESLSRQLEQKQKELQQQQNSILEMEIEISNYQQESMLLNSDNDNLNMRISNLEEDMNAQIMELTQNFKRETQIQEQQLEQLQHQNSELEKVIQSLKQEQTIMDGQKDDDKRKVQANENERISLLSEIKDYQLQLQINVKDNSKMKEDLIKERMKIVIFASEIDRLWKVIEDFTNNLKAYEEQSNLQNEKIHSLTKSIQQYQNIISQQDQDRKQQSVVINQSLESKIALLASELERVRGQLNVEQVKVQDFDGKQRTYLQEIEELYTQIDVYQQEISNLQKHGLELRDLEMKFQAERMSWETQKYQLNNQLQDNEQRLLLQIQETKRLNIVTEERLHEIESLRLQLRNQNQFNDYDELKQEYTRLDQQLMEFEQINLKLKANTLTLEKQNQLLDSQLQGKIKEMEEAYSLMNKQRKQSEQVNKEAENNRKTLSIFQQQNSNLENQIQCLQEQLHKVYSENENLLSQMTYLQNCLIDRDLIVQNKNQELSEKIKEIDQMKIKYEQKINISTLQSSVVRSSSLTKQIPKSEQENIISESFSKSKYISTSIIQRPPRQAMAKIDTENNNQYQ